MPVVSFACKVRFRLHASLQCQRSCHMGKWKSISVRNICIRQSSCKRFYYLFIYLFIYVFIYCLTTLSGTQYSIDCSADKWIRIWKGCNRRRSWPDLCTNYLHVWLEVLRSTTKNVTYDCLLSEIWTKEHAMRAVELLTGASLSVK